MKIQSDYTDKTYIIDLTDFAKLGLSGDRVNDVGTNANGRGGFDGKSIWISVRTFNK